MCKDLVPYQVQWQRSSELAPTKGDRDLLFNNDEFYLRPTERPTGYVLWMEQDCKWKTLGLKVVEMEKIIKDISVQIFVSSSLKIKENCKTISEEIGWGFF